MERLSLGRKKIHDAAAELISVGRSLNLGVGAVVELKEKLDDITIRVAVVGEVNRGKSTFLNALMRAKLFPPRATVCTAAITALRDGDPRFRARFRDGSEEADVLPLEDGARALMGLVSKKNPKAQQLERVDVWFPNSFAREGAVLIDTPGVNDPETWREQITIKALAQADAAIFLLDAHKPLTRSERNFLQGNVLGALVNRVIFVVNKCDRLSEEDLKLVLNRCQRELSQYVANPQIHLLAALPTLKRRLGLDAPRELEESFESFEDSLNRFLGDERVELTLGSRRKRLHKIGGDFAQAIDERLRALEGEREQVLARLDEAEEQLKALRKRYAKAEGQRQRETQRLPRELGQRAEEAWDRAKSKHLLTEAGITQVLSAASQGREAGSDEIQSLLADTRRSALSSVENELKALSNRYEVQLGNELVSMDQELRELTDTVVGSISRASDPALSDKIFRFAGELVAEGNQSGSVIEAVAGFAAGAVAAAFGIVAGLMEMVLGGGQGDRARRHKVRIELESISERGKRALTRGAEEQAARIVRGYVEALSRENRSRLDDAELNLQNIESDVRNDEESIAQLRKELLALRTQNHDALSRLR